MARTYTTGDIAAATGTSRRHVLNIVAEVGAKCEETGGGHRRFSEGQAKRLIREIELRREPRYKELMDRAWRGTPLQMEGKGPISK